jgi:hypothetical protein
MNNKENWALVTDEPIILEEFIGHIPLINEEQLKDVDM